MMTVAPPVVQPSLGLMALMQGVAVLEKEEEDKMIKHVAVVYNKQLSKRHMQYTLIMTICICLYTSRHL